MKIAIIGAGRIGEVLISRLLSDYQPGDVIATHPREDRRRELHDRYGILVTRKNCEPFQMPTPGPEAVILCVEPGVLPRVLDELRGKVPSETLVISVVNGVPIDDIVVGLDHPQVVRAMPNSPSRIGRGMVVWAEGPGLGLDQMVLAKSLLSLLGTELSANENGGHEQDVTRATPVFGSQPGIVFFLADCLARAAEDIGLLQGLPPIAIDQLILRSLHGDLAYALASGHSLSKLRQEVTSPGGTTERMIEVLAESGLPEALIAATRAGYERSRDLARAVKMK